jgi:hypothetical protein
MFQLLERDVNGSFVLGEGDLRFEVMEDAVKGTENLLMDLATKIKLLDAQNCKHAGSLILRMGVRMESVRLSPQSSLLTVSIQPAHTIAQSSSSVVQISNHTSR